MVNCKLYPKSLGIIGFYILKFQDLDFTPLKFGDAWIFHFDVLEFGFYPLCSRSVWILLPKVLGCLDFTP